MAIPFKLHPRYHVSPPINDCQVVRLSPDGMCYVYVVEEDTNILCNDHKNNNIPVK